MRYYCIFSHSFFRIHLPEQMFCVTVKYFYLTLLSSIFTLQFFVAILYASFPQAFPQVKKFSTFSTSFSTRYHFFLFVILHKNRPEILCNLPIAIRFSSCYTGSIKKRLRNTLNRWLVCTLTIAYKQTTSKNCHKIVTIFYLLYLAKYAIVKVQSKATPKLYRVF